MNFRRLNNVNPENPAYKYSKAGDYTIKSTILSIKVSGAALKQII